MTSPDVAVPPDHPRRLNLGCGFDHRDGYLNVDFQEHHSPDLMADVRDLSMLADGGYEELLAIDVLEHLPRSDTATCLAEWARVLQPEGLIHLQVPDLRAVARKVVATDAVDVHELWIHQLWGTQAYTGDFHLAAFTDLTLVAALAQAGFHRIRLGTRDQWMLTADAHRWVDGPRDPLATGFGEGFSDLESGNGRTWRWTDTRAELLLVNTSDAPVVVDVGLTFAHAVPGRHRVSLQWAEEPRPDAVVKVAAGKESPWSTRVSLPTGPKRLVITSDAPPADVPDDPRRLVTKVFEPTITVVS